MKLPTNISNNNSLKKDLFMLCFIVMLPFCFYLYNIVPKDSSVWTTKWFEIDSGYFEDVEYYIWFLFVKVLTIGILTLWYISCAHWWRAILIIPISIEIYKIFSIWHATMHNTEGGHFLFLLSLIISIPFILLLFYVANKLNYYKPNNLANEELNTEINEQIKKLSKFKDKDYQIIQKEMEILLKQKNTMTRKIYLTKLLAIRDRFALD